MVELMQKGLVMAAAHASRSQMPIGTVTNVLCGIHGNAAGNLDLVSVRIQRRFGERQ